MDEGFAFDLAAADWRRSLTDEKSFVEALATRLSQALPEKTRVERERHLFSKEEVVRSIAVAFDRNEYMLHFEKRHGVRTERAVVVRGIRLKTEPLEFSQWLSALSTEITEYANSHMHLRSVLEQFLMS